MSNAERKPVPIIFDTDIESDVDDAGAVAVLHALADRGEAKILAMGVSSGHPWSAPCLDALNTFLGRPDIPIGVPRTAEDNGSKYARGVAQEFPHRIKSSGDLPEASKLYRRILAKQQDRSVVLVTVGFLTNMRDLLKTGPDNVSALSGKELVRKKVRAWVCMGGAFPKGKEWNVHRDATASVHAITEWPTPIVFSGFEIGSRIKTGAKLRDAPKKNPVRRSYDLYNGLKDRESWDQTAVLYAVRGLDGGLKNVWDVRRGVISVNADGSNTWKSQPKGRHSHLVEKMPPERTAEIIEGLMMACCD
jgi:inosine-uridine nucleoside N-ribohydrolase